MNQLFVRDGLFIAVVALSLVPLTGFAGQISLAQMTFAGLGGVIAGVMGAHLSPWGAIVGVAVTAVVGALVALPALRLQGIYLALATAAFSMLMYEVFFLQDSIMPGNTRQVPPLKIGGLEVSLQRRAVRGAGRGVRGSSASAWSRCAAARGDGA